MRQGLLLAGLVVLALGTSSVADGGEAIEVTTTSGAVYAYGHRLEAPYTFTGVEDDTLCINGVPYSPRRTEWQSPPYDTLAWKPRLDLIQTAKSAARAAGPSPSAALEAALRVFRSSSLVDSAATRPERGDVAVYFVGEKAVFSLLWPPFAGQKTTPSARSAGEARREMRLGMIRALRETLENGGAVVFGEHYHTYFPSADALAREIEACLRGDTVDAEVPSYLERLLEDLRKGE